MTNEIPPPLSACVPGVGRVCTECGRRVVDAIESLDEPFLCVDCRFGTEGAPTPAGEDALTQAALLDAEPHGPERETPTFWRLLVVIAFAVIALAIVFWNR